MSSYFLNLHPNMQDRYLQKISLIDNFDPYTIGQNDFNISINELPVVTLCDIIVYFAVSNSFDSDEQLRSYKALEAYEFCKAGFVLKIECAKLNNNFLVLGEASYTYLFVIVDI